MLKTIIELIKAEFRGLVRKKTQISLWGLLFVTIGLIAACSLSVPIWFNSFKILPGGAPVIFFGFLFSVLFFFFVGAIFAIFYDCRSVFKDRSKKAMLDISLAYVFRLLWLSVFFGINAPFVALLCLIASIVFLTFTLICAIRVSKLISIPVILMIAESVCFTVFTLRFMLIN